MATNFLMTSRHGTVFFFRRRVPKVFQAAFGKSCLVRSLKTADRKLATKRARTLAVHTDQIFNRLAMAKKSNHDDSNGDIRFDYTMKILFKAAIAGYYQHAKIKPQTKATYRCKLDLDHAMAFFSKDKNVLRLEQADVVKYYSHIVKTTGKLTSQGLYLSTATSFLN